MSDQDNTFPKLKTLNVEHYRHLYFCGDIHGRFDLLQAALTAKQFSKQHDLLVLVGDLIDRGDFCPQVIDFVLQGLEEGFVAMVTGNHDHYPLGDYNYWMLNDGTWFERLRKQDPQQAKSLLLKLKRLAAEPLALELLTAHGKLGVVHGDVPDNCWQRLRNLANDTELSNQTEKNEAGEPRWQRALLSGRSILKAKQLQQLEMLRVTGIDYVVSGHVVVRMPEFITNRAYIDTGAYYTERLSILSLPELIAGFAQSPR